jgi:deoxycytidylate deaminase
MDSEPARLSEEAAAGGEPMAENAPAPNDCERRVAELTRINAGLAAEVRALATGVTDAPRGSAMTTSRRIGVLIDERDTLVGQLEETRVGLAATRASLDELARQNQELVAEIAKLRFGYAGMLRRARARLLRR